MATVGTARPADLFVRDDESGVWFEDPVLLEKLATERQQAASNEVATRWKLGVGGVLALTARLEELR